MNYSNITLYRNNLFYNHQNYKIDNIEDFLNSKLSADKRVFERQRYWKIDGINKEVNLDISQDQIKAIHEFNYARVQMITGGDVEFVEWTLYYFVVNFKWLSKNTIKIILKLDTLNTFLDNLEFHPKTFIEREHIDRWNYSGYKKDIENNKITLIRDIPTMNEGLNPLKYLFKFKSEINFDLEEEVESIYYNSLEGGVNSYLQSKGMIIYSSRQDYRSWIHIVIGDSENGYLRNIAIKNGKENEEFYINLGGTPTLITSREGISFNREQNFKILSTPYCPSCRLKDTSIYTRDNPYGEVSQVFAWNPSKYTYPETNLDLIGVEYNSEYLVAFGDSYIETDYPIISEYISPNNEIGKMFRFSYLFRKLLLCEDIEYSPLIDNILNNGYFKRNDYSNESALYNGEFLSISFNYDSYEKVLLLENLEYKGGMENFEKLLDDNRNEDYLIIKYHPPILASNGFSFTFFSGEQFKTLINNYPNDNALLVSVNNQAPSVDSKYLDYMRNGYNYDIKIRDVNRQQRANEIEHSKTSFGANIPKRIINPFNWIPMIIQGNELDRYSGQSEHLSRLQEDLQMEKNQAQLKAQKLGVENLEGGLEKIYLTNRVNKLIANIQAPRKNWWKYLEDYFYYFGNKSQYYGIPTHNNRCLFDYLKCKAEFVNRNSIPTSEALNDIIDRLNSGVTFIHKFMNQWTFDSDYKENIEVALYNIINPTKKKNKKEKKL